MCLNSFLQIEEKKKAALECVDFGDGRLFNNLQSQIAYDEFICTRLYLLHESTTGGSSSATSDRSVSLVLESNCCGEPTHWRLPGYRDVSTTNQIGCSESSLSMS